MSKNSTPAFSKPEYNVAPRLFVRAYASDIPLFFGYRRMICRDGTVFVL